MSCRIQSYLGLDHLSYIFLSVETSRALGLPWESIWIWRGGGTRWFNWKSPPPSKSWDRTCGPGQPSAWSWGCNPVLACGAYSVCSFSPRQLLGLVSCPSFFLGSFIIYLHTSSGAVAWLDTQMERACRFTVWSVHSPAMWPRVSHVAFLCKMGLTIEHMACRVWEYRYHLKLLCTLQDRGACWPEPSAIVNWCCQPFV